MEHSALMQLLSLAYLNRDNAQECKVSMNDDWYMQTNYMNKLTIDSDVIIFKTLNFYNVNSDFRILDISLICDASVGSDNNETHTIWNINPINFKHIPHDSMYTIYDSDANTKNITFHLNKLGIPMKYIAIAYKGNVYIKIKTIGNCTMCTLNIEKMYYHDINERQRLKNDSIIQPIVSYGKISIPSESTYENTYHTIKLKCISYANGLIIHSRSPLKYIAISLHGIHFLEYINKISIHINCIKLTDNTIYLPLNECNWDDLIDVKNNLNLDRINEAIVYIQTDAGANDAPEVYAYLHNHIEYGSISPTGNQTLSLRWNVI